MTFRQFYFRSAVKTATDATQNNTQQHSWLQTLHWLHGLTFMLFIFKASYSLVSGRLTETLAVHEAVQLQGSLSITLLTTSESTMTLREVPFS